LQSYIVCAGRRRLTILIAVEHFLRRFVPHSQPGSSCARHTNCLGSNGESPRSRSRQVAISACSLLNSEADADYRSIGVSNFNEKQLEILLSSAKIKPAANQVSKYIDYGQLTKFKARSLYYVDSPTPLQLPATVSNS
jgi:hypothetical protein